MHALTMIAMLAAAALAAGAQSPQAPATSKQLAVVNGQAVTEQEVQDAAAGELETVELRRFQAEANYARDRHGALERALKRIVDDTLVGLEAAKRGVTKDQLLQTEVDERVPAPTDEEVTNFYEANKSRIQGAREEAFQQVRNYLIQGKGDEIYATFIDRLKKEYDVKSYLEPFRVNVATEGYPAQGPAAAPVTLVEFSDFECPYCGGLFPTLKLVERNYDDKVRIVFRQFPLTSIHPHAQKAAEASLCANDQRRFWELHDAMFSDQQNLTIDALESKAAELKLDAITFNSCLESGKYADAVKKEVADGIKAGVSGTPAMFINGRFLSGNQPYGEIRKVIEEELQRSQAQK